MDFSKIDEDFSKEIIRGAEAYLDGQLKIAIAADHRASSLAGMYAAATTALVAAVVTLSNSTWSTSVRVPLAVGGGIAALLFLTGAWLCLQAVMPVQFSLPGFEPDNLDGEIKAGKKLHDCRGELARHLQDHIDSNHQAIKSNANKFKWGAYIGIAAPLVGFIVWLLISVCGWIR